MSTLKVGVVGVGRMGQRHCRVYDSIRKVHLAGIHDTNKELATKMSLQYDVPYYEDYRDLLAEVDAISIATPTPYHFEQTQLALDNDVHVLVEKPITERIEDAFEITLLAEAKDLIVQIGHIERFNPAYIELKHVIENLTPIATHFYRLSPYKGSNKDVDVILDLMIHDTNLYYDLFGNEPDLLDANGTVVYSDLIDHAYANISIFHGPLVSLSASRVTEHKVRLIEVIAREAYVRCDLLNKNISIRRSTSGEYLHNSQPGVKYHQESVVEWINVPAVEPLALQQQAFIDSILDGKTPLVSASDGYKAMKLALRIRERVYDKILELSRDKSL